MARCAILESFRGKRNHARFGLLHLGMARFTRDRGVLPEELESSRGVIERYNDRPAFCGVTGTAYLSFELASMWRCVTRRAILERFGGKQNRSVGRNRRCLFVAQRAFHLLMFAGECEFCLVVIKCGGRRPEIGAMARLTLCTKGSVMLVGMARIALLAQPQHGFVRGLLQDGENGRILDVLFGVTIYA